MFIRNLFYGLAIAGVSFITACGETSPLMDKEEELQPVQLHNIVEVDEIEEIRSRLSKQPHHRYQVWHEGFNARFNVYDTSWIVMKFFENDNVEKIRVRYSPCDVDLHYKSKFYPSQEDPDKLITHFSLDNEHRVLIPFTVNRYEKFTIEVRPILKDNPLKLPYEEFIFNN